jgi:hypothetical protein
MAAKILEGEILWDSISGNVYNKTGQTLQFKFLAFPDVVHPSHVGKLKTFVSNVAVEVFGELNLGLPNSTGELTVALKLDEDGYAAVVDYQDKHHEVNLGSIADLINRQGEDVARETLRRDLGGR